MTDFYFNTAILGTVIGLGSGLWYFYEQYQIKERKEHEESIKNLANSIRSRNEYDYRLEVVKDLVDRDFSLLLTFLNDIEIQELRRIKREYEDKLRREAEIRRQIEHERRIQEQERLRQEREGRLMAIARRFDTTEINNLSTLDFQDLFPFLDDIQIALAKARRENHEAEKRLRHETDMLRRETERLNNTLKANILANSITACNNDYARGFSKGLEDGSDIGNLSYKNKNRNSNFFMTDKYIQGYDLGYQKGYNKLIKDSATYQTPKVVYMNPVCPPVYPAPNLNEIRKEIKQDIKKAVGEVKEEIQKEARKEKNKEVEIKPVQIDYTMMFEQPEEETPEEEQEKEHDIVKKQMDVLSMMMN